MSGILGLGVFLAVVLVWAWLAAKPDGLPWFLALCALLLLLTWWPR